MFGSAKWLILERRPGAQALAAALLLPLAAFIAQPAGAQPVVQPIPDPAAGRLAAALQTLSRNPQSLDALLSAGEASLRLDDFDAATAFFTRAEAVAPADGRVKAGRASIMLRRERPVEALQLFAQAERLGAPMAAYSAERGLAYDLVGDNASAQRAYALALTLGADDAVTRRLAISHAIGGDRAASEATLLPLLQRQDHAAYRARAFALAILGEVDQAVSIAETMLPARLSNRMAPYLRYMRRLTPAQQAAAANLGRFPRATEIGREDPSVAALSDGADEALAPDGASPRGADARLVPSGEPMGPRQGPQLEPSPSPAAAPFQPPGPVAELPPAASAASSSAVGELPAQPQPSAPAWAPQQLPGTSTPAPPPGSPASPQAEPMPEPPATSPPLPTADPAGDSSPVEPAAATDGPTDGQGLASAFAPFTVSPRPAVAAAGAVDITAIEPRREPPPPLAQPAPLAPPHPSREWIQLATGRDTSALAFDWRRIRRQAGVLLEGVEPHLAAWGQSTRLLAGPYANAREAQALVSALKAQGIDTFRFTSAAGEQVRPLD